MQCAHGMLGVSAAQTAMQLGQFGSEVRVRLLQASVGLEQVRVGLSKVLNMLRCVIQNRCLVGGEVLAIGHEFLQLCD